MTDNNDNNNDLELLKELGDIEELYRKCIEAIDTNKLYRYADITLHIPLTVAQLKASGILKRNGVIKSIETNKLRYKSFLRNKWKNSDNPTLNAMLYRMVADSEEFSRIATSKTEVTGRDGEKLNVILPEGVNAKGKVIPPVDIP